jgi:hypothetical protein
MKDYYQHPIGEGGEKNVFQDPIDPKNKVRIEFKHGMKDVNQIKGRYYLQKIIHLLFPKNTPDIYLAGAKPNSHLRMQRIKADSAHEEMQKIIFRMKSFTDSPGESERLSELERKTTKNPKVEELIKRFHEAGIRIDTFGRNYAFDETGEVQYLDNQRPWELKGDGTISSFNFDENLLHEAILKLPPQRKIDALKYFERLMRLKELTTKNEKT